MEPSAGKSTDGIYKGEEPEEAEILNEAILEYLHKNGYKRTLEAFRADIQKGPRALKSEGSEARGLLMNAFQNGWREGFFRVFDQLIPTERRDSTVQKLEFYLRVHFATYPMRANHPGSSNQEAINTEMQQFKEYLEEKGSSLSKTPEFLTFYAFPYIKNPWEHPTFSTIFTDEWLKTLREQLDLFLLQYLPTDEPPLLQRMLEQYYSRSEEEVPKTDYENLHTQHVTLQEQFMIIKDKKDSATLKLLESQSKWTCFAKDILAISKELLKAIHTLQAHNPVPREFLEMSSARMEKYEAFLNESEMAFKQGGVEEEMEQRKTLEEIAEVPDSTTTSHLGPSPTPIPPQARSITALAPLDYGKIKHFLRTATDDSKICTLLQGLKQRLLKIPRGAGRKQFIHWLVSSDLLGCANADDKLLEKLLRHPNRMVVEHTMTLLNILSSINQGGDYIIAKDDNIKELVHVLLSEKLDSSLMQTALGAVEKVSIKRKAQNVMLQLKIIEWICRVLKKADKLHDYTLEYGTALLMNLALRTKGKQQCENPRLEVLAILKSLLDKDNPQIRTHVNGTLYSLFTLPSLKKEARRMGFEEQLQRLMRTSETNLAKQLSFMLDQLKNEDQECCPSEEEEVGVDESDDDISCFIEEEDEKGANEAGDSTGEALLCGEFLATSEEALRQSRILPAAFPEDQSPSNSGERPITPVSGAAENPMQKAYDSRIPSAMRARPKIPRTPIPLNKLEQVRKENEEFLMKAVHIQKNEAANKKKQVKKENDCYPKYSKEEELEVQPLITDIARQKVMRSEIKNRGEIKPHFQDARKHSDVEQTPPRMHDFSKEMLQSKERPEIVFATPQIKEQKKKIGPLPPIETKQSKELSASKSNSKIAKHVKSKRNPI